MSSHEFDPYGNRLDDETLQDYGYTGEWWADEVGLLHLRARWYLPETGMFLSVDPVESEPPYLYVRGNPINRVDPSGMYANFTSRQVQGIQEVLLPWLFDSVKRHNMPNTNLGDGAFAALLVTILKNRKKFNAILQ